MSRPLLFLLAPSHTVVKHWQLVPIYCVALKIYIYKRDMQEFERFDSLPTRHHTPCLAGTVETGGFICEEYTSPACQWPWKVSICPRKLVTMPNCSQVKTLVRTTSMYSGSSFKSCGRLRHTLHAAAAFCGTSFNSQPFLLLLQVIASLTTRGHL